MTFRSADCESAMPRATSAVASRSLPATTIAWKRRRDFPRILPSASQRLIGWRHVTASFRDPYASLSGRLRHTLGLGTRRIGAEDYAIHGHSAPHDSLDMCGLITDANGGRFRLRSLLGEQCEE